jgi:hypothetical protein
MATDRNGEVNNVHLKVMHYLILQNTFTPIYFVRHLVESLTTQILNRIKVIMWTLKNAVRHELVRGI